MRLNRHDLILASRALLKRALEHPKGSAQRIELLQDAKTLLDLPSSESRSGADPSMTGPGNRRPEPNPETGGKPTRH